MEMRDTLRASCLIGENKLNAGAAMMQSTFPTSMKVQGVGVQEPRLAYPI